MTWNSARDIIAAITSLNSQTVPPVSITVVDNASTDGTPDLVAAEFPAVNLVRLKDNIGFAAGNNLGILECEGDWYLLLNPDATIEPEWTEKLLLFSEADPAIGMVGGILWRSGTNPGELKVIDSLGIEIYRSFRVRDAGTGEPETSLPTLPTRVFGVCAAAVLLKREMLTDISIGGEVFPERFFCYYEDADLAWRAWRRGWQAWIVPTAQGVHSRGGSPVGSRFSRYLTHRNRLWLILRNARAVDLPAAIPALIGHEVLMAARLLRYPYLWKAVREALAGTGKSLREHKLLPDKESPVLPFMPGIGFKKVEKRRAIKQR